jgi:hypothetical protein
MQVRLSCAGIGHLTKLVEIMTFFRRSILALYARAAAAAMAACCALGAGQFEPAHAKYVIELFTSQGCSSCPPADQWLESIARRPDVIAVSLPVDYWDYIGWRDTLASPAFTARQKAYAALRGDRRVYTPQVVVNGLSDAAGSDEAEINRTIQAARAHNGAMTVPMRLSKANSHYSVEVAKGDGGPASVFALRVARATAVEITRGENAGRSVTYTNVVRAIDKLGDWTGETATFDLPGAAKEGEGFVVLVQKGTLDRPGVILAAAKTEGL